MHMDQWRPSVRALNRLASLAMRCSVMLTGFRCLARYGLVCPSRIARRG